MKPLKIITDPNKILRQKSVKVKNFDNALRNLIEKMIFTMQENNGVGLSAIQIGKPLKIVIVEFAPQLISKKQRELLNAHQPMPLTILINPKITKLSKQTHIAPEGCLSLPDVEVKIERPSEVSIIAQDINGEKIRIRAKNYHARILQHELDHLEGVLIIDKAKNAKI